MNVSVHAYCLTARIAACCFVIAMWSIAPAQTPDASAKPKVSYANDIHPFLAARCGSCHMGGRDKGGFRMDTRDLFLKGGDTGPAIIIGKSDESLAIQMVEGKIEGLIMPMKGPRLTPEEIGLFRNWIDQGFEWDITTKAREFRRAPLAPRMPTLPDSQTELGGLGELNLVDRILAPYFVKNSVDAKPQVTDAQFARRVWLDAVGLLPDPKSLNDFIAASDAGKHEKLVTSLLENKRAYAEHWMTFWNDALRNDFVGTGYIDGGRKQITNWLYDALYENKPFDQFARELIRPTEKSEGFIKGIVWRGVTNASQTPAMQAAQNISQIFVGTNMKCASCHDSFVNAWKLKDAYGLAAIFSDEPLDIIRCDVPQGEKAEMKFLYPELGEIDPTATRDARLEKLADLMTRKENGRFARTIVNRLWAQFMGRGIVEPLDDMDQSPWNEDLLDALAYDLAENKFDLKRTMKIILTSRAYRMPSRPGKEIASSDFIFEGPLVRRITVEQFLDSLGCVAGVWQEQPGARLELKGESAGSDKQAVKEEISRRLDSAYWIWRTSNAAQKAPAETVYFLKSFDLPFDDPALLDQADAYISCDNAFTLYLNGTKIGGGTEWNKLTALDLRAALRPTGNILAVEALNTLEGAAGLVAYVQFREGKKVAGFGSDPTWICSPQLFKGWEQPGFIPLDWPNAVVAAELNGSPWRFKKTMTESVYNREGNEPVRAWLAIADPLMRALGRPNREQVVTRRASTATTLEALEMTNGATLSGTLKKGAAKIVAERKEKGLVGAFDDDAISDLYLRALGRKPNSAELELAKATVASGEKTAGLEDLLWSLAASPEFQLIY